MRNLLNSAVEELVVRVNRELKLIRQEIKITTATGDKWGYRRTCSKQRNKVKLIN